MNNTTDPTPTIIKNDSLRIAGREFYSRLMLGTGKYSSSQVMQAAVSASGAEVVTVALRRIDLKNPQDPILEHLDSTKLLILPNTSGARDHIEAVRLAHLAVAGGMHKWVKLEVTPEPRFLMPDPIETFKAAEILIKDGFTVLPYINADPILAKRLEEIGCATVMPLGAPIGSNRGLETIESIQMIIDLVDIPVVVDAGIGKPSDAALALEIGAAAVMINTAVAVAGDPVQMAGAFKLAVEAGRKGFLAKLPKQKLSADPSSPTSNYIRST